MTTQAGAAIADHGIIRLIAVGDDLNRSCVNPASARIGQKVSLQSVWQIENDFSARRIQPQRISEDVLITGIASEIVAPPVRAERRNLTFQHAIVLRNAA